MLCQILDNQKLILERLDFLETFGPLEGAKIDNEYNSCIAIFPLQTLDDERNFEIKFETARLFRKLVSKVSTNILVLNFQTM